MYQSVFNSLHWLDMSVRTVEVDLLCCEELKADVLQFVKDFFAKHS